MTAWAQRLVHHTFKSFADYLDKPSEVQTKDRKYKNPLPAGLKVESVWKCPTGYNWVNYHLRRSRIIDKRSECDERIKPKDNQQGNNVNDDDAWSEARKGLYTKDGSGFDVKTNSVKHPFAVINEAINECYLFLSSPRLGLAEVEKLGKFGADPLRSTTEQLCYNGALGNGFYFAESSLKADENLMESQNGQYPLVLCRVLLGRVDVVEAKEKGKEDRKITGNDPSSRAKRFEFDSTVFDGEIRKREFREFVVGDPDQIYPEYIVWVTKIPRLCNSIDL